MTVRGYDPMVHTAILLGIGSAHAVAEPEGEPDKPVGRLLLPDPEQQHGWREYYVKAVPSEKPGRRPIGFGR